MIALPNYDPEDKFHRRWVRAVVAALGMLEPVRIVRRYDGDLVPFDVATGVRKRPVSVSCVAATRRDDRASTESNARVTWAWVGGEKGVVRISAIDLTSATAEYDITLEVRTE